MHSGSSAEGVGIPGSDVDIMYWQKHHIVVQDQSQVPMYNSKPNILLLKRNSMCPGFVKLECLSPHSATLDVRFSLTNIEGRQYFTSRRYTQFHLSVRAQSQRMDEIHGPSITTTPPLGTEHDNVICLRCHFWPDDAYEFITRERLQGWPPEPLIQQILSDGIHLVPIGSRSRNIQGIWEHDSLEWRYSFSMAELTLIHSFNATQFRMYGLLKIILRDVLKPRVPKDTLCSYFMKTVLLWEIEESSPEIWHEANTICLLGMCFKRLCYYVSQEKCPCYFMPTQNIFHGKVYGNIALQTYEVMTDLYMQGWRFALECELLSDLEQDGDVTINTTFGDSYICREVIQRRRRVHHSDPIHEEFYQDLDFYSSMQSMANSIQNREIIMKSLANAANLHDSEQFNTLTFDVTKAQFHRLSCDAGLALFHELQQGKFYITSNKRAKQMSNEILLHLLQSLDGDISRGYLSLATVLFLLGNPAKALGFIKAYRSKQNHFVLYLPRKVAEDHIDMDSVSLYRDVMCGRNLSRHEKASIALSYGFEAYQSIPVLPLEILPEILLVHDTSYILSLHPQTYSCFLGFLCEKELGNDRKAKTFFYELLNPDHEVGAHGHMTYIMAGICYRKMDTYDAAVRSFARAFREKRALADRYPHSGEMMSFQSPLFYIAFLLNLIT